MLKSLSKSPIIILLISLILLTQIKSNNIDEDSQNHCRELQELIHKDTKEILGYIDDNMHILKNKVQSCIDILIKNGKFEPLDMYLSELAKRGIKYRESLEMSINTMKKQLDDIHNKHRFDQEEYQSVFPAFQWAQSLDEIYLEIKFAHRHDSPGCLEIKDLKVDIDDNYVNLIGYCVLGDVPIKIDFHIDTFKNISKENSTHNFGSVGRYKFILKKKDNGTYWEKLLADNSPLHNNMRIWYEMREKFKDQLSKFEEKDDDDAFNREIEEIRKRAEERRRERVEERRREKEKRKKDIKKHQSDDNDNDKNDVKKEL